MMFVNAPDVLSEVKKLLKNPFYFDLKKQLFSPNVVKWRNPKAPWIGDVDLEIYLDYKNRRFVINDFTGKFDSGAMFIGEVPIKAIERVSEKEIHLPLWDDYQFEFEVPNEA